jgi:hypothetical protein
MSATDNSNNAADMTLHTPQDTLLQVPCDDVIIHLHPNDVLFGRGSGPNDHEGNIRFRLLVNERKGEYLATNHRQTKAKIARDVVNHVLALNGRFLKKVEAADAKFRGIPKGVDAWLLADEEMIMEKAKQALRQQRERGEKSPTSSPVPQAKSTVVPSQLRLENFSVMPPYLVMSRPEEIQIPSMSRITADSPLSSGYSPHSIQMQHNPYEPLPIRFHNNPSTTYDWQEYTASNITSHHPVYAHTYSEVQEQHRMEQMQSTQQHQQVHCNTMPQQSSSMHGQEEYQTTRVGELMDSFNKLKTKNIYGVDIKDMNESSDTMGTIEPLPMHTGKDTSTLCGISMSSSTFSLMKNALDSDRLDGTKSMNSRDPSSKTLSSTGSDPFMYNHRESLTSNSGGPVIDSIQSATQALQQHEERPYQLHDPRRSSINIEDNDFFATQRQSSQKLGASGEMSMSLSQVWKDDKRQSFINHAICEGKEDEEHESHKDVKVKPDPRPLDMMDEEPDNMSSLGKSSMSILNIAMGESVDSALLTAPNDSIFSDIGD